MARKKKPIKCSGGVTLVVRGADGKEMKIEVPEGATVEIHGAQPSLPIYISQPSSTIPAEWWFTNHPITVTTTLENAAASANTAGFNMAVQ